MPSREVILRLFSPAKINLCLEVLNKRKDGAHNLRTVFERIGLCDRITLKTLPVPEIRLKTDAKDVPAGRANLAFKAAELLQKRFRVRRGVEICLIKKIPVRAGLGGGSSNAACVLLGLNRLWKLRLSKRKLRRLGAELGSDVAFFILDTSFALGTGRGEILRKIPAGKRKLWHCVVKPPFGISTREAYEGLDLKKLTPPRTDVKMLVRSIQKGRFHSVGKLLINSLELSLSKRVRAISELKKNLLRRGASGALLSGSGSACFGLFDAKKAAEAAARVLRKDKKLKVFVASTY